MVIHPDSKGKVFDFFEENARTARVFKKWAISLMKNVKPLEVEVAQSEMINVTPV